jgi:hypothetical protein
MVDPQRVPFDLLDHGFSIKEDVKVIFKVISSKFIFI